MSFNNLLLAVTLTVLWPLGLMGVLAAAEWLERRTLAAEFAPRRLRPTASTPPEAVETEVVEPAADLAAATGPAAGRPVSPDDGVEAAGSERLAARRLGGGRHLRRAGGGRGSGRHERRG